MCAIGIVKGFTTSEGEWGSDKGDGLYGKEHLMNQLRNRTVLMVFTREGTLQVRT